MMDVRIDNKEFNGRPKSVVIQELLKGFPPSVDFDSSAIRRKWMDIPYSGVLPREKLDIYLPDTDKEQYPVIVWLHGGAWIWGRKDDQQLRPIMKGLERGYAVVSVGYSLSGEAEFPTSVYEVKAALRWIRAHAREYHLDPERMALWGASAGAHLACLAGLSGDKALTDPRFGWAGYSSAVRAVVDWCGPIELGSIDAQNKDNGFESVFEPDHPNLVLDLYMGGNIEERQDAVKLADAAGYISEDAPYVYIQHGEKDNQIPLQQSRRLFAGLKDAAGAQRVKLEVLKDVGHHGSAEFETDDVVARVFDFLDAALKTGREER